MWYKVTVSFTDTTGEEKKQNLLVEADLFGTAEADAYTYCTAKGYRYVHVTNISTQKITAVLGGEYSSIDESLTWYKGRAARVELNGKGKEKRTKFNYVIYAPHVQSANEILDKYITSSVDTWEIEKIEDAKIADVCSYSIICDNEGNEQEEN